VIKRQLEDWLARQVGKPHIVQIQGLRQTGKTTLMDYFRTRFPKALHFPLQNLPLFQRYEAAPERWSLEIEQALKKTQTEGTEPLHVFVDEIQKIPLLYHAIQGLYDAHKGKIKFWIWGSSARPVKRKRAETLAGRVFTKILMPLSQEEIFGEKSIIPSLTDPEKFLAMGRIEPDHYALHLQNLFRKSALPEPYLSEENETAALILESYQATYLENEIRRENLVQDTGIFQKFLVLAASEDTTIANYAAKAKVLGISPVTVQNYYHILEDTFVCSLLPAYSGSVRIQISKSPKIYFADPGIARFTAGERGEVPPQTASFGKWFEAMVIAEFQKQVEYYDLPWKLFYFRSKGGLETDLVIQTPEITFACEIKGTDRIDPTHFRNLEKFRELDPSIHHGIVISLDPRLSELAPNIYHIPAWDL